MPLPPCCDTMTYAAEYDRLWHEARALCASEAATTSAAALSARERARAASALLSLRTRLASAIAAVAQAQNDGGHFNGDGAGQGETLQAGPAAADDLFPDLARALASLEQRLSSLQQAPSSSA